MNFVKLQSLGNDFMLFDLRESSQPFELSVPDLCDRYTGIGADGVLLLHKGAQLYQPKATIYNANGSAGGLCLNGIRCIAWYLVTQHNFPDHFSIQMGEQRISVRADCKSGDVTSFMLCGTVGVEQAISINGLTLSGIPVFVGNPHFICTVPMPRAQFEQYAPEISTHRLFSQGTNVEYVQPYNGKKQEYDVRVYERGVGFTRACSSGAAAIMTWLWKEKQVLSEQKIFIRMPGGTVIGWITAKEQVALAARASIVFWGALRVL